MPLLAVDKPLPPSLMDAIKAADPATFVSLQVEQQTELTDDGPEPGDGTGISVAVSGDWAAAGAPDEGLDEHIRVGAVYVFQRNGIAWELRAKLRPPAEMVNSWLRFGGKVALDASTLLVGGGAKIYAYSLGSAGWDLPENSQSFTVPGGAEATAYALLVRGDMALVGRTIGGGAGGKEGFVAIFERSGTTWSQTATLLPSVPYAEDEFGYAAAWDGDTLAIGAPASSTSYTPGGNVAGAVHLYTLTGGQWVHTQKLTTPYPVAPPLNNQDNFGSSVALSGTRLLVSAPKKKAVYAYRQSAGSFAIEATLATANVEPLSVTLAGDHAAVVGSSAYGLILWQAADAVWSQVQTIKHDSQSFASAVMDNGRLLIGAPGTYADKTWPTLLRPVVAYDRVAGNWVPVTVTMPTESQSNSGDNKGRSLSASGDRVAVGVPGDNDLAGGLASGRVDIYLRTGSTWALEASLKRPDRDTPARFGDALSLQGDTLLVGAPIKVRDYEYYPERAYVFQRVEGVWTLQARLLQLPNVNVRSFGAEVYLRDDLAFVGTDGFQLKRNDPMVRVFRRTGTTWKLESTLLSPATVNSVQGSENGRFMKLDYDGQRLIVGLSLDALSPANVFASGGASIYRRSGTKWVLEGRISPIPTLASGFGSAVSLRGSTALIAGSGRVGAYHLLNNKWVLDTVLTSATDDATLGFGAALALENHLALVGQTRNEYDFFTVPQVVGFIRRGDRWSRLPETAAFTGPEMTLFGGTLALTNKTLAIGASNWGARLTGGGGAGRVSLGSLRQLPKLRVYEDAAVGSLALASGSTLTMTDLVAGKPAFFDLVLTNEGIGPLDFQSFQLSGDQAGDFQILAPDTAPLAGLTQRMLRLQVLAPAGSTGMRRAALLLASDDPVMPSFTLNLEVQLTSTPAAPVVISAQTSSHLVSLSDPALLTATVSGSQPLSYQWFKDGRALKGAARRHYAIDSAAYASGGRYQLRVMNASGTAWSPSLVMGVVGAAPLAVQGLVDRTLVLSGPAVSGPGIAFAWSKDGSTLVDDAVKYRGSKTPILSVLSAQAGDAGSYALKLSLAGESYSVSPIAATVLLRPVLDTVTLGTWDVADTVDVTLTAQNQPATFAVKGLPSGVVCQSATGRLTGRPLRAGLYPLTITATNAAGTSAQAQMTVTVIGLGDFTAGDYRGTLQRHAACNLGHGGLLSISFTSAGAGTGTLTDPGGVQPFTAQLNRQPDGTLAASAPLPLGFSRQLNLTITPGSNLMQGTLSAPGHDPAASLLAYRNQAKDGLPAHARQGRYTLLFEAAVPATSTPAGYGYAVVDVDARGNATLTGHMADGEVVSQISWLGLNDELLLHRMMAKNRSSVLGSLTISSVIQDSMDWYRTGLTGRVYASGFPLHTLVVKGEKYLAPGAAGFLPTLAATRPNAELIVSAGGLTATFTNTLYLSPKAAVAWVTRPLGAQVTRLSFDTQRGTFFGSVLGTDPGNRWAEVSFYGAVLASETKGGGYFMRPVPSAGASPNTAPLVSGRVELLRSP